LLSAYLKINDPVITLSKVELPESSTQVAQLKLYRFYHDYFFIIDGFEKEGSPCVMILDQPKIGRGSFAGIKPGVIILSSLPEGFDQEIIDLKENLWKQQIDQDLEPKYEQDSIDRYQSPGSKNLQVYKVKKYENFMTSKGISNFVSIQEQTKQLIANDELEDSDDCLERADFNNSMSLGEDIINSFD